MRNTIYRHNVLKPWPLPDKSVDVIVTSPPYWGLRDYGTGTWAGGDAECNHKKAPPNPEISTLGGGKTTGNMITFFAETCDKCGAKRVDEQLGMEETPKQYVQNTLLWASEAHRVLKDTGTLWLNLADSYAANRGYQVASTMGGNASKGSGRGMKADEFGLKPKDLVGIPWMTAFALRSAGWYLRQDIIWSKPNPMPESVTDRCTKSHEYIFLFSKSNQYYYDAEAIKENATDLARQLRGQSGTHRHINGAPGQPPHSILKERPNDPMRQPITTRNKRSVWSVTTVPFDGEYCTACGTYYDGPAKRLIREVETEAGKVKMCKCGRSDGWVSHFATFPPALITDCIKAGASLHGNCAGCGEPWERITEAVDSTQHTGETQSAYPEGTTANRLALLRQAARAAGKEYTGERRTVGWEATCKCKTTDVMRPVILDCFMGSGTTGLVAQSCGMDYIGIELNPHNIAMANARLRQGTQQALSF